MEGAILKPADVRFAVDGMLLSLAKWLRLMGYDCAGGPGVSGRRLLEQAVAEGRVFLTRNAHLRDSLPRRLLEYAQIHCLAQERLADQLRFVVDTFSLDPEHFAFSRCAGCNESLTRVSKRHLNHLWRVGGLAVTLAV